MKVSTSGLHTSFSDSFQAHTRHSLSVKTNHNTSEGVIAVGNIKVDLVGDLGTAYLGFAGLGEEEEDSGKNHQDGDRKTLKSCHDVFVGCAVSTSTEEVEVHE